MEETRLVVGLVGVVRPGACAVWFDALIHPQVLPTGGYVAVLGSAVAAFGAWIPRERHNLSLPAWALKSEQVEETVRVIGLAGALLADSVSRCVRSKRRGVAPI